MPEGSAVEGAAKGAGNVLTHKVGPLPVWAWGGVVLIVGGTAYLLLSRTSQGQQLGGQLNGLGQGLTGGLGLGGGTPTATPTTTPAATLTNAQWLQSTVGDVAKTTGLSVADVTRYLNDFLSGTTPQGNNNAASNAQKAIAAALTAGGQPPNPPSTTSSTNPFNTVQDWLSAILGDVQAAGGSGAIQTEITNLVNGNTTTISQAAANALQSAEDLVGGSPVPLSYQVATPASAPAGPSIQLADLLNWQNTWFATGNNAFSQWVADAPATVRQAFNYQQLQGMFQFFETNAGTGGYLHGNNAQVLQEINNWLANPSTVNTRTT